MAEVNDTLSSYEHSNKPVTTEDELSDAVMVALEIGRLRGG